MWLRVILPVVKETDFRDDHIRTGSPVLRVDLEDFVIVLTKCELLLCLPIMAFLF